MKSTIILSLCLSLTSAQLPNYFQAGSPPRGPSPGSWSPSGSPMQSAGWQSRSPSFGFQSQPNFQQFQPYRGQMVSRPQQTQPSVASIPSPTLSSLSGYNRFPALQSGQWSPNSPSTSRFQSGQWSPDNPSTNRVIQSYGQPSNAFAGFPRSPGAQLSGYARPAAPVASAQPGIGGIPASFSWNINHQSGQQAGSLSAPAPAPQSQQVYRPPTQSWAAPAPQPQAYRPQSPPTQSWPVPAQQVYRSPAPTTQSWPAAPAPAPQQSWSPPAQTYSAPVAPQSAPQSMSTYQSPQNAQNVKPAPVHYASIGQDLQGDYKFGYHTGDGGSFREETRLPDGTVQGAYGFTDADGKQRIVKYTAGKNGFQAEGDDVPKGTPVGAGASGQGEGAQPASAPINFDEGAAFKSFSQG